MAHPGSKQINVQFYALSKQCEARSPFGEATTNADSTDGTARRPSARPEDSDLRTVKGRPGGRGQGQC